MSAATDVLNVVSYNIHKGLTLGRLRRSLRHMRDALHALAPDLVLAQEVMGSRTRSAGSATSAQFEYLAEEMWPFHAYGRNAVHVGGDHGNAVLSRWPIRTWENIDISLHPLERRGILHVEIDHPVLDLPLHVCCTHLNLLHRHRKRQVSLLAARIREAVPGGCPLIVGGDFNDWRTWVTGELSRRIGVRDAHVDLFGRHARTYPAWHPILALDRIYVRGLSVLDARVLDDSPWHALSDHLGLQVTLRPLASP